MLFALALWGVAFGGAATQLQTATAIASGDNADVANSLVGVAFNLAIFGGGFFGGLVITDFAGLGLPVVMVALAAAALLVAVGGRRSAFPTGTH